MMSFICALPLISALFSACVAGGPLATGYVEGEYALIAPVANARVETLSVARGDRVRKGQTLAVQETRDAEIALAQASAALAQARSRLADLQLGRRDEEIRVIEANLDSARAQLAVAEKDAARVKNLLDRGIVPQSRYDDAEAQLDVARARVAEVQANLAVARLPARPDEIAAAKAAVAQAAASRDAAAWALDKRTLTAPADGVVYEVLRRPGEIAGPQIPALEVLPDGAVILRVYVPEKDVARVAVGARLAVRCDGCGPDAAATVTYVSDAPEFTPPVIYSLENRQKLVYLVEARPDAADPALKPGQIVDVDLAETPR